MHTVYNFTHSVYISHTKKCEFELPDVSLRCFVVRQLLSPFYALSSVKILGLKLWLCKNSDKYDVCTPSNYHVLLDGKSVVDQSTDGVFDRSVFDHTAQLMSDV